MKWKPARIHRIFVGHSITLVRKVLSIRVSPRSLTAIQKQENHGGHFHCMGGHPLDLPNCGDALEDQRMGGPFFQKKKTWGAPFRDVEKRSCERILEHISGIKTRRGQWYIVV